MLEQQPPGYRIGRFTPGDEEAVIGLWSRCGLLRPWNDPRADIARKLAREPAGFLVVRLSGDGRLAGDGRLIGAVMVGYDGHRGWVNYLAVDPDHRGQGLGRLLMAEAERYLTDLGCPKLNLQVRSDNAAVLDLYAHLGYVGDDVVSLGKRLISDQTAAD